MENNTMNPFTANPAMNANNSVNVELASAAIAQLPGYFDLAKMSFGECEKAYERTLQLIESTYSKAIQSSQDRTKMYLDQLSNTALSAEERVRLLDLTDKEAEYRERLENTKRQQIQEVQDKYAALTKAYHLTVGGVILGLASPFVLYGGIKLYQTLKK